MKLWPMLSFPLQVYSLDLGHSDGAYDTSFVCLISIGLSSPWQQVDESIHDSYRAVMGPV